MEDKEYQEFLNKFEDYFNDPCRDKDNKQYHKFEIGLVNLLDASRVLNVDKTSLWGYCNRGRLSFSVDAFDPLQEKWIPLRDLFTLAKEKGWI